MSREIDLIPSSYKERKKIQQWCHLFLLALAVVVSVTLFLRLMLDNKNKTIQTTISQLQQDKSFNLQQQQKYNNLLSVENRLKKNLEILDGLRGGPTVRQVLLAIDRVFNASIWFTDWSFMRAGEFTEAPVKKVQTGYFIIIPPENNPNGKQQTWKLNTHMTIKGQAIDHTSFSLFVQQLLDRNEIDDVKIVSTQVRPYINTQVIDFNIIVIVNNQFK